MKIIFSSKFAREFNKIKDQNLKIRILKNIKKIQELPESGKSLKYDFKRHRRLVINPFRIIYRIGDNQIIINCFEHRKDVYRR